MDILFEGQVVLQGSGDWECGEWPYQTAAAEQIASGFVAGYLEINALDFSHVGKQQFLVKILFIRTEDQKVLTICDEKYFMFISREGVHLEKNNIKFQCHFF